MSLRLPVGAYATETYGTLEVTLRNGCVITAPAFRSLDPSELESLSKLIERTQLTGPPGTRVTWVRGPG